MEPQTTAAAIDDFEELIQMDIAGSTQEELLTWLGNRGVMVSRSTLFRRLKLWQEESPSGDSEQLTNLIISFILNLPILTTSYRKGSKRIIIYKL
jgi:hypothetical protein